PDPALRHRRGDLPDDLRDRAVGLANGDGPAGGRAHHHALEDGLAADRCAHVELAAAAGLSALELALEALHAAAGVDQLLLASVEGVAGRADLDVELGLRRPGLELVAARAAHGREHVVGMDAGLHRPARIAEAVSGAALPPETTATTVSPGCSTILPARSAAVAAAPAGSQASFARL